MSMMETTCPFCIQGYRFLHCSIFGCANNHVCSRSLLLFLLCLLLNSFSPFRSIDLTSFMKQCTDLFATSTLVYAAQWIMCVGVCLRLELRSVKIKLFHTRWVLLPPPPPTTTTTYHCCSYLILIWFATFYHIWPLCPLWPFNKRHFFLPNARTYCVWTKHISVLPIQFNIIDFNLTSFTSS